MELSKSAATLEMFAAAAKYSAPWKNPDKTGQPYTTRHICGANQPLKKGCPVLSRFDCPPR